MSVIDNVNLNNLNNNNKMMATLYEDLERSGIDDSFRRISIDSGVSMSPNSQVLSSSDGEQRRKKKKRVKARFSVANFHEAYELKGETLGEGSYGKVETCIFRLTGAEYAVKIVNKSSYNYSRAKIMKEIELYYLCKGRLEIIQLIDYFEDQENFYLIFEKAHGGPLLSQIQRRIHFTEHEASAIIRDLAKALSFLHERGIAHRDLKPENVLCLDADSPCPVKLCDFDLCSSVNQTISTPRLQSPVGSAEYMAPEVVEIFDFDDLYDFDSMTEDEANLFYDKRCDLWSLGIIAYILLCGFAPFQGRCGADCGWDDRGEACADCQQRLFSAIKNGSLEFPDEYWSSISDDAKDLIRKLLVREASQRLDANSVLKHPWIVNGKPSNHLLDTPQVLRRQQSVKDFNEFTTNAVAIKRNVENPFSFASAFMTALPEADTCHLVNNNTPTTPTTGIKQMKKSMTSANLESYQSIRKSVTSMDLVCRAVDNKDEFRFRKSSAIFTSNCRA